MRLVVMRLPKKMLHSRANQVGGVIVAAFQTILLISICAYLAASLPGSQSQKQILTDSRVAKPLIQLGEGLQRVTVGGASENLTETLTLLTVAPESDKVIQLGFTTTNVTPLGSAENEVLRLINRERMSRGLNSLSMNYTALQVARAHSRDMFANGYFSHKDLQGRSPFDRMKDGRVRFGSAGENLALAPTAELAHSGLMNSPGHKANILSPNYKTVGIGVIDGGQYGLMITQDFTD